MSPTKEQVCPRPVVPPCGYDTSRPYSRSNSSAEAVEDRRNLAAERIAIGQQIQSVLFIAAADQTDADCPAHRVKRPVGDLILILEANKHGADP